MYEHVTMSQSQKNSSDKKKEKKRKHSIYPYNMSQILLKKNNFLGGNGTYRHLENLQVWFYDHVHVW